MQNSTLLLYLMVAALRRGKQNVAFCDDTRQVRFNDEASGARDVLPETKTGCPKWAAR
jgi:hypothetical protein